MEFYFGNIEFLRSFLLGFSLAWQRSKGIKMKKEKGFYCRHGRAAEVCKISSRQTKKQWTFMRFDKGWSLKGQAKWCSDC